jgi:hypothetical protein
MCDRLTDGMQTYSPLWFTSKGLNEQTQVETIVTTFLTCTQDRSSGNTQKEALLLLAVKT